MLNISMVVFLLVVFAVLLLCLWKGLWCLNILSYGVKCLQSWREHRTTQADTATAMTLIRAIRFSVGVLIRFSATFTVMKTTENLSTRVMARLVRKLAWC